MDLYAMYVRKSRYDSDFEAASLEETLKRHISILEALAKKMSLNVMKVYREVASGESISQRPQMQKLLDDVSAGTYSGVLVMDIDRLSRGNSIDQGIVSQTFKYSDTKIITPSKIYDPNNEFDEEYFEFSLFMSRKEYKIINKRLERGRKQSAKEGRFMGSIAPYGYERVKIKGDKGYTLKTVPEEAEYVKMIFQLYNYEGQGASKIANRLNALGVPTRTGVPWSHSVVKTILQNCVYAGLIRCSRRLKKKTIVDGKVIIKQTNSHEYPIYPGLHPAIVPKSEWELAQDTRKANNRANIPLNHTAELQNYFAGLIFCKGCGGIISRVTAGRREPRMLCRNTKCTCVSSAFDDVSEAVRASLTEWLNAYKKEIAVGESENLAALQVEKALSQTDSDISAVNKQIEKCYVFLEKDVYTIDEFTKRREALTKQLEETTARKKKLTEELSNIKELWQIKMNIIPTAEKLLERWYCMGAQEKNRLLKQVLGRIEYFKAEKYSNNFIVDIFPNV